MIYAMIILIGTAVALSIYNVKRLMRRQVIVDEGTDVFDAACLVFGAGDSCDSQQGKELLQRTHGHLKARHRELRKRLDAE